MSGTRVCSSCGVEKSTNSFYKNRKTKGKVYINGPCIDCRRIKSKRDYRESEQQRLSMGLSRSEVKCAKLYDDGPWQTLQKDIQLAKLSVPLR